MPVCFLGAFMQLMGDSSPAMSAQEKERDAKSKVAALVGLVIAGFAFGGGAVVLFSRAMRGDQRSSSEN